MKTKLNIVEEPQTTKVEETLLRDSRQLKVKTGLKVGVAGTGGSGPGKVDIGDF